MWSGVKIRIRSKKRLSIPSVIKLVKYNTFSESEKKKPTKKTAKNRKFLDIILITKKTKAVLISSSLIKGKGKIFSVGIKIKGAAKERIDI